jgi:predicted nucleotidyltransferase
MVLNHSIMVRNEKHEILKFLIGHNSLSYTIRELSILRKINYKSAYEAIKKLENENSITLTKKGNTVLCQFKRKFNESVYLAEKSRLDELLKKKHFRTIKEELTEVKFPFIALVFGSYAKNKQTKNSDIDLLLISEHPKEIEQKLHWIPLDLHITSLTFNDFLEMLNRKSFDVVSETLKNNIILHGIEDYYRFLENV